MDFWRNNLRGGLLLPCLFLAWTAMGWSTQRALTLRGQTQPPLPHTEIALQGLSEPFVERTTTDSKGRFQFSGLLPGPYLANLLVPGRVRFRHTVEVTPSFADERGRVKLVILVPALPEVRTSGWRNRSLVVSEHQLEVPNKARSEVKNAGEALRERNARDAIRHLQRAVEIDPQYAEAWNWLGIVYRQANNLEKSQVCFRQAILYEPEAYEPEVNLGGVLLALDKYQEALAHNEAAVRMDPADAQSNAQLGINHYLLGHHNRALKYLGVAKSLDPAHSSYPQLWLAKIYLRHSDQSAAARELKEFLRLHPDSAKAVQVRREVYNLTHGQAGAASGRTTAALSVHPSGPVQ